jgi:isoleucyl-tRNA synthetase
VDIQREEFKRLGVGGEWDRPYTTMAPSYEARIAEAFGGFYGKNLVYQALKSVRWCFTDRTALAEAELEYEERQDPAIWVKFPLTEGSQGRPSFAVAWTTTPWTVPSNVAIAVHPDETYVMLAADDGSEYLVAERLAEDVARAAGWKEWAPVSGSRWTGADATRPSRNTRDKKSSTRTRRSSRTSRRPAPSSTTSPLSATNTRTAGAARTR